MTITHDEARALAQALQPVLRDLLLAYIDAMETMETDSLSDLRKVMDELELLKAETAPRDGTLVLAIGGFDEHGKPSTSRDGCGDDRT